MSGSFTTTTARNIFYGGTLFFLLVFLALTFQNEEIIPKRDRREMLAANPQIAEGKKLWETNNCIGCHTLLGEGAYFAPELGNVVVRLGSKEAVKAFIQGRPAEGIPGRRSMPQFNFSDKDLDAIADFLEYVSKIDASKWPPNIQG
ncbi:MAG: cytochrome c [Sterolibacteriaceae bacterium MAG5]|nr:cytochrome c [Candidatus Nitricoxidireducens bremensis]